MDKDSHSRNRWECIDFELEIREGGSGDYPVAVRSPAGEAQEQVRFPFDQQEIERKLRDLEIALLRSGGRRRRMPSKEEWTVQEFGQDLFEALLVGEVRTRYAMSLDEARRQGKGLRLKLHIQPPELTGLPWEFLYDSDQGEYLCLSSQTPLVRYVDLRQPVERLPVDPPLRILGMVSSPSDLDELEVEDEKRLVEEAIKDLRADGKLELTWLEGQTWRDLQRAMRRGSWHIFHFVGHGDFDPVSDEGRIALSNETGRKHLLKATQLARLLDDHQPLRLAFLNSCEGAQGSEGDPFSSTAATLVRRGIPAVVAMQYEISDKAAIGFSRGFYEAVADGLPVDAAVTEARTAVSMDSALEWGTPVLYMRSPDGCIFDISSEPPTKPPQELKDREKEDSLSRYRECVESAWADGEINRREAEWLRDLANDKLELSPSAAADIERQVMGDTIEAIIDRQAKDREEEERQKRLDELYDQARQSHQNQEWQAVDDVFGQIQEIDSEHPDPEGLQMSARESLTDLERTRKVAAEYDQGVRHMEAEEWSKALECFEEVQRLEPDYQETERLLSQVRRELTLQEARDREGKLSFQEADRRYADLKQQRRNGDLSTEELYAQLNQLRVQDNEDRWWMKHEKTGEWYYYNGTTWVQGIPPGYRSGSADPSGGTQGGSTGYRERQRVQSVVSIVQSVARGLIAIVTGFVLAVVVAGIMKVDGSVIVLLWVITTAISWIGLRYLYGSQRSNRQ